MPERAFDSWDNRIDFHIQRNSSIMALYCAVCRREPFPDQPYYCQHCFIPIKQYQNNAYTGDKTVFCSVCNTSLGPNVRDICTQCTTRLDLEHIPTYISDALPLTNREKNRSTLAKELLNDTKMTNQMLEMIGIGHLSKSEQAVALTALSREKMNFYASDYNFTEAHTLVDMGYGLATELEEEWAKEITQFRMGAFYVRSGDLNRSASILWEIYENHSENTTILRLRKLEILAQFALANSLMGLRIIAREAVELTLAGLRQEYELMLQEIDAYLNLEIKESHFLGMNDATTSYPRVDLIAPILTILVEEAITRNSPNKIFADEVLDRMIELDNMIDILAKMSPQDDPVFFASHLRDYIRLFNGIYWYGEALIANNDTKRQILLELAYDRVLQWIELIPLQFWFPLRPARFLEIFFRAEKWSKKINGTELCQKMLDKASKYSKPTLHYVIAEAEANVGRLEYALQNLQIALSPEYDEFSDDTLRALAERLKWSISLEALGILTGIKNQSWEFEYPITVHLLDPDEETESKPRSILFAYDIDIVNTGLGIFSERLLTVTEEPRELISAVNSIDFINSSWKTPHLQDSTDISGIRFDIAILQGEYLQKPIYLLFQGVNQEIINENNLIQLKSNCLLILRGYNYPSHLEINEIQQYLVDLLSFDEKITTKPFIFVLRKE